jgi:hypothetical protein
VTAANVKAVNYLLRVRERWYYMGTGRDAESGWAVVLRCEDEACGLGGEAVEHRAVLRFHEPGTCWETVCQPICLPACPLP